MADAAVPISAMIDVVFLLIIFFVVTASIDKEVEDEVVILAKAPHGKPMEKKDPRSFIVNIRKEGKTFIAGIEYPMSKITEMLTASAAKWGKEMPIVIRADQNVQHEYVKRVMEAVTNTGLYRVKFNAVVED